MGFLFVRVLLLAFVMGWLERRVCCRVRIYALKSPWVGVRIKDPDGWFTFDATRVIQTLRRA